MSTPALISWNAPEHLHIEKKPDWYWAVGIITLALVIVAFLLNAIIVGIFILVASTGLVISASRPSNFVYHEINDRGIVVDGHLHPFLSLESFWIPHDEFPPKIILKSRKLFAPYLIIYIDEVDPEEVRTILLKYIAETEHHEPLLKHILERFGF